VPFPTIDGLRTLEIGSPGEMRHRLNQLILDGTKRATAGLLAEYGKAQEPLESVGEILVLVDDDGEGIARMMVTRTMTTSFAEVPWEFAESEGEGDRSIEEWREGHRRFWASEGDDVEDHTSVVLNWFQLVDTPPT
jgi:uncharacterized protein YhfF